VASSPRTAEEDDSSQRVLYDDMVSDEEYVVVDGKDVSDLVEELRRSGLDNFDATDEDEGFTEDFLNLAEKRSDEQNVRDGAVGLENAETEAIEVPAVEKAAETPSLEPNVQDEAFDDTDGSFEPMEYFKDDHLQFMPSWARKAYLDGEHETLEEGSRRIGQDAGVKRLHDIVDQRKRAGPRGIPEDVKDGDGILDCTVLDVGEDYNVPVEFVVDAMLDFGVPLPIDSSDSIRNKMTSEEIERLLKLITSFDAKDIADRYSDRTIQELTDDYDLDETHITDICAKEKLHLCLGKQTRLSLVREDRVLDIALKNGSYGEPYPPLLDGLQ